MSVGDGERDAELQALADDAERGWAVARARANIVSAQSFTIERLEAALLRYGTHRPKCAALRYLPSSEHRLPCDCGWYSARADIPSSAPSGPGSGCA